MFQSGTRRSTAAVGVRAPTPGVRRRGAISQGMVIALTVMTGVTSLTLLGTQLGRLFSGINSQVEVEVTPGQAAAPEASEPSAEPLFEPFGTSYTDPLARVSLQQGVPARFSVPLSEPVEEIDVRDVQPDGAPGGLTLALETGPDRLVIGGLVDTRAPDSAPGTYRFEVELAHADRPRQRVRRSLEVAVGIPPLGFVTAPGSNLGTVPIGGSAAALSPIELATPSILGIEPLESTPPGLPLGLSLAGDGQSLRLQGSPDVSVVPGTYTFTATAVASHTGASVTGDFALTVDGETLFTPPPGTVLARLEPGERSGSPDISIDGPPGTTYQLEDYAPAGLPEGLYLDFTGGRVILKGTVAGTVAPGDYSFEVAVRNQDNGEVARGTYLVEIVQVDDPALAFQSGDTLRDIRTDSWYDDRTIRLQETGVTDVWDAGARIVSTDYPGGITINSATAREVVLAFEPRADGVPAGRYAILLEVAVTNARNTSLIGQTISQTFFVDLVTRGGGR